VLEHRFAPHGIDASLSNSRHSHFGVRAKNLTARVTGFPGAHSTGRWRESRARSVSMPRSLRRSFRAGANPIMALQNLVNLPGILMARRTWRALKWGQVGKDGVWWPSAKTFGL
jgi:hypothetical protein